MMHDLCYMKKDLSKVIEMTTDENLICRLWSYTNGYFSKTPESDPRKKVAQSDQNIKEEVF